MTIVNGRKVKDLEENDCGLFQGTATMIVRRDREIKEIVKVANDRRNSKPSEIYPYISMLLVWFMTTA